MEELFLCCFLSSFQKVDVVNEQQISFPVTPPKLRARTIEHRANEFVHELLGSYICDTGIWTALECLMRNGLHEVCFTESGISVYEKGVVDLSWSLTDGMCCCCCELVRFPDDKKIESVSLAEWRRA